MSRHAVRLATVLAITTLGSVGDAHGAALALPRLASLVGRARAVVTGTVTRVDRYDDGRVSVAHVRADRTLKGDPGPGEVPVVEEHDRPSSTPLLGPGAHVAVFLQRAERTSALARALPPAPQYWRLVDGTTGLVATSDAETGRETAALLGRIVEATRDTVSDPATRIEQARALAFDEVAARHPRLVADGATALPALPALASALTDPERARLARALERTDLPDWTRLALIDAVASAGLTQLGPTLAKLRDPSPAVLAASWRALARLGQSPSAKDLAAYATSGDPLVRAVVPAALLAAEGDAAIPEVERMALRDADAGVRRAAVDALGATKRDSVIPSLERVYRAGPTALRQAAATAYIAVGSPAAAQSVARLVFEGPADAQRGAVTTLLAMVARDDPLVARIRTSHPDPEIRELIEHGVEFGHHHPG
jgi:HEAT repeat protein